MDHFCVQLAVVIETLTGYVYCKTMKGTVERGCRGSPLPEHEVSSSPSSLSESGLLKEHYVSR